MEGGQLYPPFFYSLIMEIFKKENAVTSADLSDALRHAGAPQNAANSWIKQKTHADKFTFAEHSVSFFSLMFVFDKVSAFNSEEIIHLLPQSIEHKGENYFLEITFQAELIAAQYRCKQSNKLVIQETRETIAEALGALYLRILAKQNKINQL